MEEYKKGEAPWETQETFNAGEAPWETKAHAGPEIIEEMHPKFTKGERLLLKNFANSPKAAITYLQKAHPEMEIIEHKGQILGRSSGELQFRPLDPNPNLLSDPGKFIKDLPLDVADAGTDLGMGVASGAASAAAGVTAGAGSGGLAAIPAAMAASGATNASLEALRQKLGQKFGIDQKVSGKDVAIAGGVGALSPLLFGTGASTKQIANEALKKGVSQEALAQSQRGLGSRAIQYTKEKLLPGVGSYVSGVPTAAIKERAKNSAKLSDLKDNGITDYVENVHERVRQGIAARKNAVGQKLEQEITEAGGTVNLQKTKSIINEHINKLETSELKDNPMVKDQIASLKAIRDDLLTEVKEEITLEPQFSSILGADGRPMVSGAKEVVTKVKSPIANEVSAKKAFELQELLKDQAELTSLKQGTTPRFGANATASEKAWAEANRKAYNAVNEELDLATDGMSSELKNDYREYAQLQRDLNNRFSTPDKTYQTLSGIHGQGKQLLKERLERVAKVTDGKVNPLEEANTLAAYKYFMDHPSKTPISAGGATSTSRSLALGGVGGAIGYKAGGKTGAALGYAAGNYIGSPAAINHYINAGQAAQKGIGMLRAKTPNLAYPAAPLATWEMLRQQEENMP